MKEIKMKKWVFDILTNPSTWGCLYGGVVGTFVGFIVKDELGKTKEQKCNVVLNCASLGALVGSANACITDSVILAHNLRMSAKEIE